MHAMQRALGAIIGSMRASASATATTAIANQLRNANAAPTQRAIVVVAR